MTCTVRPIWPLPGSRNGAVSIDELLLVVNIALGNAPASGCLMADMDGGGTVTIDELLTAVSHALGGC